MRVSSPIPECDFTVKTDELSYLFFFTAVRDWSKIPRVMCSNQSSQGNYQSISICNSKVCSPAFLRVVSVLTIWNYTCDILTQTQRYKNRSVLYLCCCHKKYGSR